MTKIIIFLLVLYTVKSYKILTVFPTPAPSHYFLGNALARGLAEAGHNVTMISHFEDKKPTNNGSYRNVVLRRETNRNASVVKMASVNAFVNVLQLNELGHHLVEATFSNREFQNFIELNETFDVVIMQHGIYDGLKVLAYKYKAPMILFSTLLSHTTANSAMGNPNPSSYVPDLFLGYTRNMSIWQRFVNTLMFLWNDFNMRFFFLPQQEKIMKKYFPGSPDLSNIAFNASLMLLNSHESVNSPVPYVPTMINIGGFHVNPPKTLPSDLKEFLDNAEKGAVYFSMGSNIKTSQMDPKITKAIIKALEKIEQKVLWKCDEDISEKPDNFKLGKWFPQQDILAHPNVKLFITHGGLLSTIETVYHGVPVLALPVFADQTVNAKGAEEAGYAISLAFKEITEEKFSQALDKMLRDERYTQEVKKRSALLHDRPVKPMDLAVYWTEYIVRHNGAPHLRVKGLDLPWYQYYLLDIFAILAFITIILFVFICSILKKLFKSLENHKLKKN